MKSLLSKEIDNLNINSYNKNNFKFKIYNLDKNTSNNTKNNNTLNNDAECKLNIHNFNPMKNSPPNNWQIRLESRLKNIDNEIFFQCKI